MSENTSDQATRPVSHTEPDDPQPAQGQLSNLGMVWRATIRYPGRIVAALLALIIAASATLAIPSGLKSIIDYGFVTNGGDVGPYFRYLLIIVVILALATAFRFYCVSWLAERVVADIRIAVQNNLFRLSPSYFEENRPSEIASRMTADTTLIEGVVGTSISVALRNLVMGIGGVIYLFMLAPKLAAMLLIAIPVMFTPILILGRKLRDVSKASQDRIADIGANTSETLGAMKVVQAFGQEKREAGRFAEKVERTFATGKRRIFLRAIMTSAVIALIFGSIILVMWQGAIDVAQGRLSGGTILAFVFTGGLVAGSFGALTEVYGELIRGSGAAARLAELLNETPDIDVPANPTPLPQPPLGRLVFENVTFNYPTRPEVSALNDFSLVIEPGETVAVVGPSGAGKSTLFQLAQRFYDPQQGRVTLDGVALPDADPADIRRRMAMVPQETVIFAASARDNLRYGEWGASDDQLWEAARSANAESFLRALPQGLDTFMGEGGARLSGGQRQRIAIARALLRDAPILLLDEATSALDAESESLVQDALDRLMQDRTTIVIAHRLATIRKADRIIVMDEGRIVEQGSHTSLNKAGGLYARLAKLQFDH